jgi:hypothetical protein
MYQLTIYVCARYDLYIQCACCMDSTSGKLTELVEFVRHSSCTRGCKEHTPFCLGRIHLVNFPRDEALAQLSSITARYLR